MRRDLPKKFNFFTFFIIFLSFLFSSCGTTKIKPIPDAETQFEIAKGEFQKKHFTEAVTEFRKLIFNYPGFAKIDSAQYLLAMSYYKNDEYPFAIGEFKKLISSFPSSSLADDASFMIGKANFELSPKPSLDQAYTHYAIEAFESFLEEYPQSDLAPVAKKLLSQAKNKLAEKAYKNGELYVKLKNYKAAMIYLDEVLTEYQESSWTSWALYQKGEVKRFQKKNGEAKEFYQKVIENYPESKPAKKAKEKLEELK